MSDEVLPYDFITTPDEVPKTLHRVVELSGACEIDILIVQLLVLEQSLRAPQPIYLRASHDVTPILQFGIQFAASEYNRTSDRIQSEGASGATYRQRTRVGDTVQRIRASCRRRMANWDSCRGFHPHQWTKSRIGLLNVVDPQLRSANPADHSQRCRCLERWGGRGRATDRRPKWAALPSDVRALLREDRIHETRPHPPELARCAARGVASRCSASNRYSPHRWRTSTTTGWKPSSDAPDHLRPNLLRNTLVTVSDEDGVDRLAAAGYWSSRPSHRFPGIRLDRSGALSGHRVCLPTTSSLRRARRLRLSD